VGMAVVSMVAMVSTTAEDLTTAFITDMDLAAW
jgi:hypothetical protein